MAKKKFKFTYNYVLIAICVGLFVVFSSINASFFRYDYIIDMVKLITEIGIMALPLTLLIIMGCIDFSMCTILSMSAALGGIVAHYFGPLPGILTSVLIGLLCGAFNGFMVSKLRLPPLITTLATMYLYRGIGVGATLASGYGTNVAATPVARFLGAGAIVGIPTQIWVIAVIALVLHVVLSRTVYGRTLYAIGLNENATLFAGIDVVKIKFLTYVLAGFVFSIAGQVLMGRFSTMQYDSADGYLMQVIIACVLGGTNMRGGHGSIGGTLLGVATIGILKGGMNAVLLPQTQQKIILGLVLLASLIAFQLLEAHDLKAKGRARIAAAAEGAGKA
ncbi:MAG: ABC transporter permease [Clostridiales bacterium]|nr:ABC transporter permease [Clostridiales bacterium]